MRYSLAHNDDSLDSRSMSLEELERIAYEHPQAAIRERAGMEIDARERVRKASVLAKAVGDPTRLSWGQLALLAEDHPDAQVRDRYAQEIQARKAGDRQRESREIERKLEAMKYPVNSPFSCRGCVVANCGNCPHNT